MIMNSLVFILIFLPMSVILHYMMPRKGRNLLLLILSLIFLAWFRLDYMPLMLLSMTMNYILPLIMDRMEKRNDRRTVLLVQVLFNLGILFIFKYLGFFVETYNSLRGTAFYTEHLIAPLGLSFYTFQVISYGADVYRRETEASGNIIDVFLYFIFFPNIVSGPIMRFGDMRKQMKERVLDKEAFHYATERFIMGLFRKSFLGSIFMEIWRNLTLSGTLTTVEAWTAMIAYTFYIYLDFSGYMDMVIAVGHLFGFRLSENFRTPYLSSTVSEFWRRWHITLGRWFRDYIYIPLGGSRKGVFRLLVATITVWFLTGLWHGTAMNFIVWGLYYGVIILLERFLHRERWELTPWADTLITLILIVVGWVFFSSEDLSSALSTLISMFTPMNGVSVRGLGTLLYSLPVFLIGGFFCTGGAESFLQRMNEGRERKVAIFYYLFMMVIFLIGMGSVLSQGYAPSMYTGF